MVIFHNFLYVYQRVDPWPDNDQAVGLSNITKCDELRKPGANEWVPVPGPRHWGAWGLVVFVVDGGRCFWGNELLLIGDDIIVVWYTSLTMIYENNGNYMI